MARGLSKCLLGGVVAETMIATVTFRRPDPSPAEIPVAEQETDLLRRVLLAILAEHPDMEYSVPMVLVERPCGVLRTRVEGRTLVLSAERRHGR